MWHVYISGRFGFGPFSAPQNRKPMTDPLGSIFAIRTDPWTLKNRPIRSSLARFGFFGLSKIPSSDRHLDKYLDHVWGVQDRYFTHLGPRRHKTRKHRKTNYLFLWKNHTSPLDPSLERHWLTLTHKPQAHASGCPPPCIWSNNLQKHQICHLKK